MIEYEKIDNYNENDIDINVIINNDYIIIYKTKSINHSHLLNLKDHSNGNDQIEDWIWDDENEWEEE